MCQTAVISNRVARLGRRSYSHRMEVVTPGGYNAAQLSRLNRELSSLYELIYKDWDTITEQDYAVFGGQLTLLVNTVKNYTMTVGNRYYTEICAKSWNVWK